LVFLDVIDILSYVLKNSESEPISTIIHKPCGPMVNHSKRDPLIRVVEKANLWTACNVMNDFGRLHRIPVISDDAGRLLGLVSQMDVIEWLQNYVESNPSLGERSVEETKLGNTSNVVSINKSRTAREAFKLILDNKVSGIAITGDFDDLYGNLSATDFKYIGGPEAKSLDDLDLAIEEYMHKIPPNKIFGLNPVHIRPVDSFKVLIRKLVDSKVHRVYVVHSALKISGVISLIDIIKFVLNEIRPVE